MANEFKVKKGLIVIGSGSNILDIQGSQGQLFSVTDSLSGSLFSVNDISGLPILEVFSDDSVKIGTFNNEAIIVNGNTSKITGSLFGTSTNSLTSSYVNPLIQTLEITGSLNVSGSSHTIQNGYVILRQVSQSLNFVDDTSAATGGVPLGGLYRNENFIVIRIT
tara:strand:- start:1676 stop:2167 length:492 start_codon:yes stop_codon:yes gene_type:complete